MLVEANPRSSTTFSVAGTRTLRYSTFRVLQLMPTGNDSVTPLGAFIGWLQTSRKVICRLPDTMFGMTAPSFTAGCQCSEDWRLCDRQHLRTGRAYEVQRT